jgi:hypothetical protein
LQNFAPDLPFLVTKFVILACLVIAAGSSLAGPAFVTMPPAITPVAAPVRAPGPVRGSADLNQAAMSQIINQLNQRQFQLSVAAAQTAVQRPIFVPQTIKVRREK